MVTGSPDLWKPTPRTCNVPASAGDAQVRRDKPDIGHEHELVVDMDDVTGPYRPGHEVGAVQPSP